jgi:NUMOD4 motif.
MRESWKPIERHPAYEVSNMARVKNSITGKILTPYDDGSGYLRVKLDGDNCRLHILVAIAHVPNPENKTIVNHKKGKKHDCRASQLEWVTQQENIQHAWNTGLCRGKRRMKRA